MGKILQVLIVENRDLADAQTFCTRVPANTAISAISSILKLIKSSGTGGRRASIKNCNFSKNCKQLEKSQFLLKLIMTSVGGGKRVPSKSCDFCNFTRNCKKNGEIAVFAKIN